MSQSASVPARREQPKALAQDLAPRRRRRLVEQEEDGDDVGLAAREPRRLGVVPFISHVVAEVQRARVRQVPRRPQHLGRRVDADDGRPVPFRDLAVAPVPVPRSTQFVTGGAPTMARAASTTSQAALRVSRPPYAKASRPAVNLCE